MIEWKAGNFVRNSNPQPEMVETPAGTFERACFDDSLEDYVPRSFKMEAPPPPRAVRRQSFRKVASLGKLRVSIK
jgi:hypothetical protein